MKLAPRLEVSKSDCTGWKPLKAEYSCQLIQLDTGYTSRG